MDNRKKDPKKLLFFLPIPILLFILVYVFLRGGSKGDQPNNGTPKQNISFDVLPDGGEKEIYGSKLVAYEKHRTDSMRDANTDNWISSSLGALYKEDSTNKNNINLEGVVDAKNKEKPDSADKRVERLNNIIGKLNASGHKETSPTNRERITTRNKKRTHIKNLAKTPQVPKAQTVPKLKKKRVKKRYHEISTDNNRSNVIWAVVHGDQKVYNKSRVKLRTVQPIKLNGTTIEKNTFIYGIANFKNERVLVKTASVEKGNNIVPFRFNIYDSDGLLGIYIPGGLTQDASKDISQEAVEQTFSSEGTSMGTEMIGKIGKAVKKWNGNTWANIPNGYKVILKN